MEMRIFFKFTSEIIKTEIQQNFSFFKGIKFDFDRNSEFWMVTFRVLYGNTSNFIDISFLSNVEANVPILGWKFSEFEIEIR